MSKIEPYCTTCIQNKNNLVCLCQFVNVKFAIKVTNLTNIAPILCDRVSSNANPKKKNIESPQLSAFYIPIISNQSSSSSISSKNSTLFPTAKFDNSTPPPIIITPENYGKNNLPTLFENKKNDSITEQNNVYTYNGTTSTSETDEKGERKNISFTKTTAARKISIDAQYTINNNHTNIPNKIEPDERHGENSNTQHDSVQPKVHITEEFAQHPNLGYKETTDNFTYNRQTTQQTVIEQQHPAEFLSNVSILLPVVDPHVTMSNKTISNSTTPLDKLYIDMSNEEDLDDDDKELQIEHFTKKYIPTSNEISKHNYSNNDTTTIIINDTKLQTLQSNENATFNNGTSPLTNNKNRQSKLHISDICNCTVITVKPTPFNNLIDRTQIDYDIDNKNYNNYNIVQVVALTSIIIVLLFLLKYLMKKFRCSNRNRITITDYHGTNSFNRPTPLTNNNRNRKKKKKSDNTDFGLNTNNIAVFDYNIETSNNETITDHYYQNDSPPCRINSFNEAATYPVYQNVKLNDPPNTDHNAYAIIYKERNEAQQPTFKCRYNPETQKFLTYPNKMNAHK